MQESKSKPGPAIMLIVLYALLFAALPLPSRPCLAAEKESPMSENAVLKAADNHELSPYTGYTREHWLEIAGKIIAGILPYFKEESGMPELVGDRKIPAISGSCSTWAATARRSTAA